MAINFIFILIERIPLLNFSCFYSWDAPNIILGSIPFLFVQFKQLIDYHEPGVSPPPFFEEYGDGLAYGVGLGASGLGLFPLIL